MALIPIVGLPSSKRAPSWGADIYFGFYCYPCRLQAVNMVEYTPNCPECGNAMIKPKAGDDTPAHGEWKSIRIPPTVTPDGGQTTTQARSALPRAAAG